ncbi:uncharacterized protein, partial [Procambarus clarkii]|uniref:uncharacterized protein n=1 Tax=Procambarus clarkii TaxID=6728 RepID=UPI003742626F
MNLCGALRIEWNSLREKLRQLKQREEETKEETSSRLGMSQRTGVLRRLWQGRLPMSQELPTHSLCWKTSAVGSLQYACKATNGALVPQTAHKVKKAAKGILVVMDFQVRTRNNEAAKFLKLIDNCFLKQHIKQPTHGNNVLDKLTYMLTDMGNFTETHTKDYMDGEIWIPNYNLYRCDRKTRSNGGVGLYIKEDLVCTELLNSTNEVVEVLGMKVEKLNLIIILIYKPPDTTIEEFTEQMHKIENILDNLANPAPDIIFLGDFNLPSLRWRTANTNIIAGNDPGNNQPQVRELLRFCNKFSLNQQITEPTRNENTLDLLFTNNDELIRDITISDTSYSDHKLIEVRTSINNGSRSKRPNKRERIFNQFNFNNKR